MPRRKLTVEEAEAENMVTDESLGPAPVPFGFCNDQWRHLLDQIQPGDEIWEFSSSRETWENLCGCGGIELIRNGETVATVVTRIN